MKKLILSIAVTILTMFNGLGQEILDYSGNPQNNALVNKLNKFPNYVKSSTNTATIINVIPSPTQSTYVSDIAFDGEYLWVEGFGEYLIHQISPINGSIIKSIPTNIERPHGLTFDGTHLWLSDADNYIIQQVDTANGNVIQSFPTPADVNQSYPGGLAWVGNSLWNNDSKGGDIAAPNDSIFNVDTSGELIQGYEAMGDYPTGLAFDGQYLWSSDNASDNIYKIDVSSFTAIDTIYAPGGGYPNGLAFDGQYLWVANNDADSLYQIDIEFIPSDISYSNPLPNELSIYPNPSSNQLTINSELLAIKRIDIICSSGKVVKSFQTYKSTIDISDLPNGIYSIQLLTDDRRIIKKFIKQ